MSGRGDMYRQYGGTFGRLPEARRRVTESCAPCRKIGQACPQHIQGYLHRLTPCGRCLLNGKECSFAPPAGRARTGDKNPNQHLSTQITSPVGANMCRILDEKFELVATMRIYGEAIVYGIAPQHSVRFYYDLAVAASSEEDEQFVEGGMAGETTTVGGTDLGDSGGFGGDQLIYSSPIKMHPRRL